MEQRLEFVLQVMKHESSMAELCRSFGISRQTGYELAAHFQAEGVDGLKPHSRAPRQHPNAIPEAVIAALLRAKTRHPSWGPKKLQPLADEPPSIQQHWPVASTRGVILARAGLTVPRRRTRGHVPPRTQPFGSVSQPNDTWCADFKGWFRTADGARCEPLTITDAHSRLLLRCQAMAHGLSGQHGRPLLEATFREYGLPLRLRTDNGVPFAHVGAGGLTALSIWWIKLGITPERIDRGQPSENGRHERMHRTLEEATARPPAATLRAQQQRFDAFSERVQPRPTARGTRSAAADQLLCVLAAHLSQTTGGAQLSDGRPGAAGAPQWRDPLVQQHDLRQPSTGRRAGGYLRRN